MSVEEASAHDSAGTHHLMSELRCRQCIRGNTEYVSGAGKENGCVSQVCQSSGAFVMHLCELTILGKDRIAHHILAYGVHCFLPDDT